MAKEVKIEGVPLPAAVGNTRSTFEGIHPLARRLWQNEVSAVPTSRRTWQNPCSATIPYRARTSYRLPTTSKHGWQAHRSAADSMRRHKAAIHLLRNLHRTPRLWEVWNRSS